MSLSFQVVDRLFARLSATYGREFTNRWEGLDENAVKSSWAHELAGFSSQLESLAWALENLPERAPNVIEFRNLARRAPAPEAPRIEVSAAGKERVQAELAKLAPIRKPSAPLRDGKQWARDILARVEAGYRPSRTVLKMAQDALAERSIFPGGAA